MDLNAARIFLEVARMESFSEAARSLGVPRSTVSRRVAALEAELGAPLLERGGRRVRLTGVGRDLYRRCRGPIASLADAEEAVQRFLGEPRGRLRVAVPTALAAYAAGDVALEYLRLYPEVRLEIVATDERVSPDGEDTHVALRAGWSHRDEGGLIRRKLTEIPMFLGASPGYLRRHPPPRRPEDLRGHRCVVVGASPAAARATFHHRERGTSVTIEVALRVFTTSPALCRRMMLEGVGIGGLGEVACRADVAAGRLVPVLEDWRLAAVPLSAYYPGDRDPPLRVRAFLDLVIRRLAGAGRTH